MKIKVLKLCLTILTLFFCLNNLFLKQVVADPMGESLENKVIYLTFDDGPSVITEKILNTLKDNDVKATFFLIGNQIKGYEEVVKRIQKEGHSIGLHTYSHVYNKIYASEDNFISEMLKSQSIINSITGEKPVVIRFPWGSRKRLTKSFLTKLHKYDFKVYDWNAYISDGINYRTPVDKLYREATKTTITEKPIILLMHCDYVHKNTCTVLPKIISFYKEQGYEFKVIDSSTPESYFPIKN